MRKHARARELYDIDADRAERDDLAAEHPGLLAELTAAYEEWIPREQVLELYRRRGHGLPEE